MAIHCELESVNEYMYNVEKSSLYRGSGYWQYNYRVNRAVWTYEKWRFAPNFMGPCYTNRNFCHPHTLILPEEVGIKYVGHPEA